MYYVESYDNEAFVPDWINYVGTELDVAVL